MAYTKFQNIVIESEDGVGILTLNRPDIRNALDFTTWGEIKIGMQELYDDPDVRVIIITGAGGKAFASGGDINSLVTRRWDEVINSNVATMLHDISMMNKPTIAAIDGYALGGGCEFAMVCDLRIATKKSKFGQPEVNLGIIPGAGGSQRLPRLVGQAKAMELIFTGDIITAEEAERIGLVNKVVEDSAALMPAAMEMANKIKSKGPMAIRLAKMAVKLGANMDLYSGVMLEKALFALTMESEDKREGTQAFLEKRPPHYR